jgi:hypothetical protein
MAVYLSPATLGASGRERIGFLNLSSFELEKDQGFSLANSFGFERF